MIDSIRKENLAGDAAILRMDESGEPKHGHIEQEFHVAFPRKLTASAPTPLGALNAIQLAMRSTSLRYMAIHSPLQVFFAHCLHDVFTRWIVST
jgi:hypothetical protein